MVVVATPASAEWYANPFLGKMANISWNEPTAEGPKVFGISAGTSPKGKLGFEIDYTSSNEFFGAEEQIGANHVRTVTAGVLYGFPIAFKGVTRLRPYGAAGGGFGHVDLGFDQIPDEEYLFSLPQQQQQAAFNCLGDVFSVTPEQATACGVPLVEDERGSGYTGMIDFGGGVMGFIAPHIGASADFRYFVRVPSDENDDGSNRNQTYWRFVFGVVIH